MIHLAIVILGETYRVCISLFTPQEETCFSFPETLDRALLNLIAPDGLGLSIPIQIDGQRDGITSLSWDKLFRDGMGVVWLCWEIVFSKNGHNTICPPTSSSFSVTLTLLPSRDRIFSFFSVAPWHSVMTWGGEGSSRGKRYNYGWFLFYMAETNTT